MAGRPKMMARRVWEYKERVDEMAMEFSKICPAQYQEDHKSLSSDNENLDRIRSAWKDARNSIFVAQESLEFLAWVLYQKARISSSHSPASPASKLPKMLQD